eukprot:NODE_563_length_5987_cov_2.002717.p6 type:complete len:115 gc:universal NODE_563_length_5987_cov_2.002717:768-424(-)
MKLFTHNIMMCNVKNCGHYPLDLKANESEIVESEYSEEFMKNVLQKIDYPVVVSMAKLFNTDLPEDIANCDLAVLHKVLMCIEVTQGQMECRKCNHIFLIRDGIPNMLLNPNEV